MESNQVHNSARPRRSDRPGAPKGPQGRDVGRLPKWVQNRIAKLEADLAARDQELNRLQEKGLNDA